MLVSPGPAARKDTCAGAVIAAALLLMHLAAGGCDSETPREVPDARAGPSGPTLVIGDMAFGVEIPRTIAEGLSGRESLPSKTGMLFVFKAGGAPAFWMKGMLFPLDFVWIGEDCTVVDTTPDMPAPAPGAPVSELPRYASGVAATYVFEINAGEVERFGIRVGDRVRFSDLSEDVEGALC